MAEVTKPMQRYFIGRAWVQTSKSGVKYINIKTDRNTQVKDIGQDCTLQLWPNKQRQGKKDANLRLSILIPSA